MKKLLLLSALSIFLFSCSDDEEPKYNYQFYIVGLSLQETCSNDTIDDGIIYTTESQANTIIEANYAAFQWLRDKGKIDCYPEAYYKKIEE